MNFLSQHLKGTLFITGCFADIVLILMVVFYEHGDETCGCITAVNFLTSSVTINCTRSTCSRKLPVVTLTSCTMNR
jgi:hypothetical protein